MSESAPAAAGTAAFWDKVYQDTSYSRRVDAPVVARASRHFGDVAGKTVLEIGSGPGANALYFASRGANVIAVDTSSLAIKSLMDHCKEKGIANIRGVVSGVLEIDDIEPVDFVFGSMILHHLEPFPLIAKKIRTLLKPGGRAFFFENNAASSLLIWFRENIVGKLWVPKYGDPDEFPLMPKEIDMLREQFAVSVEYPSMLFFELASIYILRGRMRPPFKALDAFFYRHRWLTRYSYYQYLLLQG